MRRLLSFGIFYRVTNAEDHWTISLRGPPEDGGFLRLDQYDEKIQGFNHTITLLYSQMLEKNNTIYHLKDHELCQIFFKENCAGIPTDGEEEEEEEDEEEDEEGELVAGGGQEVSRPRNTRRRGDLREVPKSRSRSSSSNSSNSSNGSSSSSNSSNSSNSNSSNSSSSSSSSSSSNSSSSSSNRTQ